MMRINNDAYVNAHGKAPKGNGNWWFLIKTDKGAYEVNWQGPLKEARKRAVEHMMSYLPADRKVVEVVTMP